MAPMWLESNIIIIWYNIKNWMPYDSFATYVLPILIDFEFLNMQYYRVSNLN